MHMTGQPTQAARVRRVWQRLVCADVEAAMAPAGGANTRTDPTGYVPSIASNTDTLASSRETRRPLR